jgi:hypothetical protein
LTRRLVALVVKRRGRRPDAIERHAAQSGCPRLQVQRPERRDASRAHAGRVPPEPDGVVAIALVVGLFLVYNTCDVGDHAPR